MNKSFEKLFNWEVRVYNKNNKMIASWIIKDRTEHDADREAMSCIETCYPNSDDWSLTKIKYVRKDLHELKK
jgi:hypothetical protein